MTKRAHWRWLAAAAASALLVASGCQTAPYSAEMRPPNADNIALSGPVAKLAQDWSKQPHYVFAYNALDPSQPPSAQMTSAGRISRARFNANDDYSGLPRTPGFELVDVTCSGCHSLEIVMQQSASRARWAELLVWMVNEQNMAEPYPEETAELLAYLSRHFGP